MISLKPIKFILRWSAGITADLVVLYHYHSAWKATLAALIAFVVVKFITDLWTTAHDELTDALRSGKPERIKAAMEYAKAAESGDYAWRKRAEADLAKTIREGT